ncbi:hypothetical protein WJX84_007945 [Apatococcus fuscideae]|uniref:Uncharacterized protein n=1 Tax=Apatococcus fuscideae TaxID=2026836 RepID=A0AAW1ST44_9CHLO
MNTPKSESTGRPMTERDCTRFAANAGKQLHINKENMEILQRLQKIYKARSAPKSSEPITPGIVLDQQLRPLIDNQEPQHMPSGGSLNSAARRQEMQRIMADNQAILRRICCSRGAISAQKLRREGEQQQAWASMRSKFVPQSELLGGGKRSDSSVPGIYGVKATRRRKQQLPRCTSCH